MKCSYLYFFYFSFNINLSTEPSIETLPEYYTNGANGVDTNVINDQIIAHFCSDTVRELNSLTEELQQTDLNDVGKRVNHDNQNSVSSRLMESAMNVGQSVHNDIIGCVQSINGDSQTISSNSSNDHTYAKSLQNNHSTDINDKLCTETEIGNLNCDVVDSSPFYNHFNQHLENNLENDGKMNRIEIEHHNKESNDNTNEHLNGHEIRIDAYRAATSILQSVDLRGKY